MECGSHEPVRNGRAFELIDAGDHWWGGACKIHWRRLVGIRGRLITMITTIAARIRGVESLEGWNRPLDATLYLISAFLGDSLGMQLLLKFHRASNSLPSNVLYRVDVSKGQLGLGRHVLMSEVVL